VLHLLRLDENGSHLVTISVGVCSLIFSLLNTPQVPPQQHPLRINRKAAEIILQPFLAISYCLTTDDLSGPLLALEFFQCPTS